MAATIARVGVPHAAALEGTISSYIAQGFVVQNRGEDFAVMFKKKEFSVLWAVVGLIVCVLPLLIYLIVYAAQSDQMVEIRVDNAVPAPAPITYSEDGNFFWDPAASVWVPVGRQQLTEAAAPEDERSDDGPPRIQ